MIIKKVDIWHLRCGFQYSFKHKLATHSGSDNLVVRLTTGQGINGYGEGIPRGFVTGESLEASFDYLNTNLGPALLQFPAFSPANLLPSLAVLQEKFAVQTCPGAFCALETALLDAAGRTWDKSLASLLSSRLNGAVTYSAVVPLSGGPKISRFFQLIKSLNLRQVKLKVGEENDLDTLSQARRELGEEVDLRVDANAAWSPAEAIERIRELARFRLSAVEQPVAKEDLEGLRRVQDAVDLPIMADESLCTLDDAKRLIDLKACQMFNIRLSKVGGLTAAIRIKHSLPARLPRGGDQHSGRRGPPFCPRPGPVRLPGRLLCPLSSHSGPGARPGAVRPGRGGVAPCRSRLGYPRPGGDAGRHGGQASHPVLIRSNKPPD